jgi:hypothetical protein
MGKRHMTEKNVEPTADTPPEGTVEVQLPAQENQPPSLLAVDVGSVNTRTQLFDVVQSRYRFLAAGSSLTTANPPMNDASEGVRQALDRMREITGRHMTTEKETLIIPTNIKGEGADLLAATYSAGEPLKVVVVGLLEDVSLSSALNLAYSTYSDIVAVINLNKGNRLEEQLDKIVQSRPDVIIIAGGTEKGANRSVLKMVSLIGMAVSLLPQDHRPDVLYAGNSQLAQQIAAYLQQMTPVHLAANVRPTLTTEQLGPAQAKLNSIFRELRALRTLGVSELNTLSEKQLVPTSQAIGRVIKYFSKVIPEAEANGVLGVDIGASATTISAAFNGDLRLRTFTNLGVGTGLRYLMENSQLEEIISWMALDLPGSYVLDYIQNKILQPQTLPAIVEDLAIEQALARQTARLALRLFEERLPRNLERPEAGLLPVFNPILVSGSVITNAPTTAQSLLMVLDALQPTGIQQIILDKNNLCAALGAAIPSNPTLVAQLLVDPISFLNLGYVISPVSKVKPGSPVLRLRIVYQNERERVFNIKQGSLQKIPLAQGQRATLYLDPLQRANLGNGAGQRVPPKSVVGGLFGVVVDARGRPLNIPVAGEERQATMLGWLSTLEQ